MLRSDFQYDLPSELIAQRPRERGRSRMMLVRPRAGPPEIEHLSFERFVSLLSPGELLVLNDTRVFPARLFAAPKGNMKRPIEVLLTRRIAPLEWEAWCKPARRARAGDRLTFSDALSGEVLQKNGGTIVVLFDARATTANPEGDFWSEIERIGATPLPPYIHRDQPESGDRDAYQTVYARERGAVAAPTAGLHFTEEILEAIARKGVEIVRITLHVGAGTFKPVEVEDIREHRMQEELYSISAAAAATLNAALASKRRVVAVGTTTVRAIESAVIAGSGRIAAGEASTSIFITPGFRFGITGALLTNFHLPESTLLMLVSAFAGVETIRAAYREAIAGRYLFYSFGDCMFLERRGGW
jgi:S-adenosylmethionine:tRNA ribosyltransferase-isomerase